LGLIPLACNEIQHLFATLVAAPITHSAHRLRWSWGDADTRPAPAPATTASRPTDREHHELRLEY